MWGNPQHQSLTHQTPALRNSESFRHQVFIPRYNVPFMKRHTTELPPEQNHSTESVPSHSPEEQSLDLDRYSIEVLETVLAIMKVT
jgi:hypothetical protein